MRYRQLVIAVLASFLIVPVLLFPFRAEVLAIPFRPPHWGVPGMIVSSVMLFALWAWLWTNRPEGVFGR